MARVVALAALLTAVLLAPTAAARPPCAQALLEDYADGSIGGTYSAACYREAIATLPADLRIYGSAQEDLTLALRRLTSQRATAPPPVRALQSAARPPAPKATARPAAVRRPAPLPRRAEPAAASAAAAPAASATASPPLPLLVLGTLCALLLVAAGASAGTRAVARRRAR